MLCWVYEDTKRTMTVSGYHEADDAKGTTGDEARRDSGKAKSLQLEYRTKVTTVRLHIWVRPGT